jgi:hypothetical protein
MNKDLELFTHTINHLVYLTTKDEFGIRRSRGIETFEHLAEDLNEEHIVPDRGYWTENSLKLFISRIMKRYPKEVIESECDIDFVGRRFWEYLSYTKIEEVIERRNASKKDPDECEKKTYRPVNAYTALYSDIDRWRGHEKEDVERQDKDFLENYKKIL